MPENKTRPSEASVTDFIAGIADAARRADAETLLDIMARASGEPPFMFGSAIIGFGLHEYRYESGHGGTMPKISFSPRKVQTVIYGLGRFVRSDRIKELGKVTTGKGCVYVKRLSDVDLATLEAFCAEAASNPSPA
ncbi:DUF1801 domain-containing protein [Sphingomonas sp. GlSt437]|uniref:DUF1801 domain-containing protein n=1 Tax=Sphingomonas sp. GlSt437 TaxID=3389970 RepID=UPI003A8BF478